jgi:hypothetical protein
MHAQDSTKPVQPDSLVVNNTPADSIRKEKERTALHNDLNNFMQDYKKKNDKAKRNALLRIGFGVLMLAVLVVGILRRRKAKAGQGK